MAIRDELQKLYDRDGHLSVDQVLAEATSKTSALHSQFDWDNKTAGQKWRRMQAAQLIRGVKITLVTSPEETTKVRAYVSVPSEQGGVYDEIQSALAGENHDVVLAQAQKELAALRRKYQGLLDFDAFLTAQIETIAA